MCNHSIVTFVIKEFFLRFSKTSHVDSLDKFRRTVIDKVKTDICIKKQEYQRKEKKYKNKI